MSPDFRIWQYDKHEHNRAYVARHGCWLVAIEPDTSNYVSVQGERLSCTSIDFPRLGFHPSQEAAEYALALYMLKQGG